MDVCRTLVPQSSSFSTESIHEFLTQVAQENLLLSWKEVMQLLHRQTQQTPTKAALTSVSLISDVCYPFLFHSQN